MILIVGAGGHGQVVADVLRAARAEDPGAPSAMFVDDRPVRLETTIPGCKVAGRLDDVGEIPHDGVIVAIGDNAVRARLFARFEETGERFAIARHPRSILAEDVVVGEGTMMCAGVVVNTGTTIGRNVILNTAASVDHHTVVGDHVHIAPGVHMGGEVRIGEGALIGIGATILPRVSVGAWSTVGAGAVVTKDVPPGATVVGVPARVMSAGVTG
jgi:sugar O-acyltransferase (sialic acid O-acetyltransferase NeuD family)